MSDVEHRAPEPAGREIPERDADQQGASPEAVAAPERQTLIGEIVRITFTNQENGYTVAKVKMKGRRDAVTVVGTMLDPLPGQRVTAVGDWQENPKYGEQFKADEVHCTLPSTKAGIRMFLKSGLIKGVGDTYADRIVDYFGAETLDILDNEPERLLEVDGIGNKKLDLIKDSWAEQQDIRELMLFLQTQGVSASYAVRLFKFYGQDALRIIKSNPYKPAMDIPGIGFLTADRIAAKLGIAKYSQERAEAAVIYMLRQMTDKGHVFVPRQELAELCAKQLDVPEEPLLKAVEVLRLEQWLHEESLEKEGEEGGTAVYLAPFHVAECGIAKKLGKLLATPKTVRPIKAEQAIDWVQEKFDLTLAKNQAEAIRQAADRKVLVITGGPGTGKTTIINAVLRIFSKLESRPLLAAPTGRAAKRMAEATGREAKTIHRLLEYLPQTGAFKRNEETPLECSLLIVDEASMIDTILMYHLLKAVPLGATLILVGDVNQLPSVGPGNVLRDIINSGAVPVVELNEIFRQAQESAIIVNAHAINSGHMPNLESSREVLSDFYFIRRPDPETAADLIVDLVKNHIPRRFKLDPFNDIQVLTPMHKGAAGATNLNKRLQEALNPGQQSLTRGGRTFKLHDKVMQIRNNYDKEVFNGDIGRIVRIYENAALDVLFDDREVQFTAPELEEIVQAYAVSVHKSQGSEYPAVVVPVLTQHYVLLQRNLIYTAITRGKKLVILVGTERALNIAVKNNEPQKRHTLLEKRLNPKSAVPLECVPD